MHALMAALAGVIIALAAASGLTHGHLPATATASPAPRATLAPRPHQDGPLPASVALTSTPRARLSPAGHPTLDGPITPPATRRSPRATLVPQP